LNSSQTGLSIGIYAALFWALGLHLIMKPVSVSIKAYIWFGGLPVLAGVVVLFIAEKTPFIRSVYGGVGSVSILARVSASIGISALNQMIIGLPLFLSYVRKSRTGSPKEVAYWGFLAGLAYGFVPTITAILETESYWSGQSLLILFRTPVLLGFLGGILGCFIAAAARTKQLAAALTVAGVLTTGVIAGLATSFPGSTIGWVLGAFTALLFVAHIRREMVRNA
jgi:hypothetical protein